MTRSIAPGSVAFVGAGPGQADLITLRGAERLRDAEVVLFDALADPALRALAPQARWVDVGKRGFVGVSHAPHGGRENTAQETINALLVKHARDGKRVVRLKAATRACSGRLEEELAALAAEGIAVEVVPGVTAALAAAAATARPLTRRGAGTQRRSHDRSEQRRPSQAPAVTPTPRCSTWPASSSAALGRKLAEAGWPTATPVLVVSRAG
jgi:uroporphyrin-III C-methyltransferase